MSNTEEGKSVQTFDYFIKKCCRQEMGSKMSRADRASRGRYVFVPGPCLDFLPDLSQRTPPVFFLKLRPVFRLDDGSSPSCIYARYALTRGEHRIYLSKKFDNGACMNGDMLVMRRIRRSVDGSRASDGGGLEIAVDWIRPEASPYEWRIYDALIRRAASTASVARVDGRIELFEERAAAARPDGTRVDSGVVAALSCPDEFLDAGLRNQTAFEDIVCETYARVCAVSREALSSPTGSSVRIVQINPTSDRFRHHPVNGIALRIDLAWAFERGFFSVDPSSLTVNVHDAVRSTWLGQYEGTKIRPAIPAFRPSEELLRWHMTNVYGCFTGSEA